MQNRKTDKNFNGATTGITLVEILVSLFIATLVIGIVSSNYPGLQKLANRFLNQSAFEEQYLVFLILLEQDYYSADPGSSPDQLIFLRDKNQDGDFSDSSERITYRWNRSKRRIDRKSGKGNFQSLLEGVQEFSWISIGSSPTCHQLQLRGVFHQKVHTTLFCHQY